MSHTIHTTPGIIIGAQYHGKANRRFTVLTRDLGMISVQAQGIRELASKSRFHMQIFHHVLLDCLHGKEGWRLIGIDAISDAHIPGLFFQSMYARIFRLLRRLVVGEELAQPALYDWIVCAYDFTKNVQDKEIKKYINILEIIIVAKVLHILGYLDDERIKNIALDMATLELFSPQKKELLSMINHALEVSQL